MSRSIDIDIDPENDGLVITVCDGDGEPEAFVQLTEDEAWQLMDSLGRYLADDPTDEFRPWNPAIYGV